MKSHTCARLLLALALSLAASAGASSQTLDDADIIIQSSTFWATSPASDPAGRLFLTYDAGTGVLGLLGTQGARAQRFYDLSGPTPPANPYVFEFGVTADRLVTVFGVRASSCASESAACYLGGWREVEGAPARFQPLPAFKVPNPPVFDAVWGDRFAVEWTTGEGGAQVFKYYKNRALVFQGVAEPFFVPPGTAFQLTASFAATTAFQGVGDTREIYFAQP